MKSTPFSISVSDTALDELRVRLQNTRWPDDADGWNNGTSAAYMKDLVAYWLKKYSWRDAERELNQLQQFTMNIDGVDVHYVHEKSRKQNAPVILLNHGWPDTFHRFSRVIPLLTEEFDVVAPSMPGFGFSQRTPMSNSGVARLWRKLMVEGLGYDSFTAAGGDLGVGVIKDLLQNDADVVRAAHLTEVGYPTGQEDPSTLSEAEQAFINQATWWSMSEGAYLFINGNKPQSVAYAFNDSPAGLAAWIISFINGGNEKDIADEAFGGRDALLTNIMIYWITQTAGTSARMYRLNALETYGGGWDETPQAVTKSQVPVALAMFPGELRFPREWAERDLNVQRITDMPRGGHFAPLEVPEIYANDVIESFKELTR